MNLKENSNEKFEIKTFSVKSFYFDTVAAEPTTQEAVQLKPHFFFFCSLNP